MSPPPFPLFKLQSLHAKRMREATNLDLCCIESVQIHDLHSPRGMLQSLWPVPGVAKLWGHCQCLFILYKTEQQQKSRVSHERLSFGKASFEFFYLRRLQLESCREDSYHSVLITECKCFLTHGVCVRSVISNTHLLNRILHLYKKAKAFLFCSK